MQQRVLTTLGWLLASVVVLWEVRAITVKHTGPAHTIAVVPRAASAAPSAMATPSPQPAQALVLPLRPQRPREPEVSYAVDVAVGLTSEGASISHQHFSLLSSSRAERRWRTGPREENVLRIFMQPAERSGFVRVELEYEESSAPAQRIAFRETFLASLGQSVVLSGGWVGGPERRFRVLVR